MEKQRYEKIGFPSLILGTLVKSSYWTSNKMFRPPVYAQDKQRRVLRRDHRMQRLLYMGPSPISAENLLKDQLVVGWVNNILWHLPCQIPGFDVIRVAEGYSPELCILITFW